MLKSPIFRLHFVVFLWGFTAILGKLIEINAEQLTFFRMAFAALFLYIGNRFILKNSMKVSKGLLLKLFGIGGLMALHWLLFFTSIKVSNVAIALSCMSLSTLFASLIEPLVFKRKIDISEIILGVIIVLCIVSIFSVESRYMEGILYGVGSSLVGTMFSVLNGKLAGSTASGNMTFYEIFGGSLLILLYFIIMGQGAEVLDTSTISWKDLTLLLVLSSIFTAYPMLEAQNLMKVISPFTLILTVNLEPIYGIILAYFIFGESEHMAPIFYIASAVMILAIFINGYIKARKKKRNKLEQDN